MAGNTKHCQFCGKTILNSAVKCPYCREWLAPENKFLSCGIGFRNPIVLIIAIIFLFILAFLVINSKGVPAILVLFWVGTASYIYMLPSIIALSKNHPQFFPILISNILLGETVIGWFLTLYWATNHRLGRYT